MFVSGDAFLLCTHGATFVSGDVFLLYTRGATFVSGDVFLLYTHGASGTTRLLSALGADDGVYKGVKSH
jgi:hypothetical protein